MILICAVIVSQQGVLSWFVGQDSQQPSLQLVLRLLAVGVASAPVFSRNVIRVRERFDTTEEKTSTSNQKPTKSKTITLKQTQSAHLAGWQTRSKGSNVTHTLTQASSLATSGKVSPVLPRRRCASYAINPSMLLMTAIIFCFVTY